MVYFTEAQKRFCCSMRDFAIKELASGAMDRAKLDHITPELISKLANAGLLKLAIPIKYGGEPKDSVSIGIVFEEVCKVDFTPSILLIIQVVISLMMEWAFEELEKNGYQF